MTVVNACKACGFMLIPNEVHVCTGDTVMVNMDVLERSLKRCADYVLKIDDLEKEIESLREKIESAKAVLVCAPIGDLSEIIETTYKILDSEEE